MKLIREIGTLLHRDLLLGFHYLRFRLLLFFGFMILLVGLSVRELGQFALHNGDVVSGYTFTDLVFLIFKGTDFQILDDPSVGFPFTWLMIQIICPLIIGGYVREDLNNQASVLFVRVHYRVSLWISKLIFCFIVVFTCYLLYLAATLLTAQLFLTFSAQWSNYGISEIQPWLSQEITPIQLSARVFFLIALTSLGLAVIQGVLSVFIRPIYVLFVILAVLVISVYSSSFLLPGSYSMILRHQLFSSDQGFMWNEALLYMAVVISSASVLGYIFFRRKDIIYKEEE